MNDLPYCLDLLIARHQGAIDALHSVRALLGGGAAMTSGGVALLPAPQPALQAQEPPNPPPAAPQPEPDGGPPPLPDEPPTEVRKVPREDSKMLADRIAVAWAIRERDGAYSPKEIAELAGLREERITKILNHEWFEEREPGFWVVSKKFHRHAEQNPQPLLTPLPLRVLDNDDRANANPPKVKKRTPAPTRDAVAMLLRDGKPRKPDEIAKAVGMGYQSVYAAMQHPWFSKEDGYYRLTPQGNQEAPGESITI